MNVIMNNGLAALVRHGLTTFWWRLQAQGPRLTILWLYGQGISVLTGIPMSRYCRITPEIFVGPQYAYKGKEILHRRGVRGTINLRDEFDDAEHGLDFEQYCYLPTIDRTPPTLAQLHEGVAFIERIVGDGGKVYIHCHGGMGRAPTMAAAYFISQGLSVTAALDKIKAIRPFINVRPEQQAQLEAYRAAWQGAGNEQL